VQWFRMVSQVLPHAPFTIYVMSDCRSAISKSRASTLFADGATEPWTFFWGGGTFYFLTRKPGKEADGHRRQRTRLVAVYRQRGDKSQCSFRQFSEIQMLRDLDRVLGSGRGHTGAHIWSRSTHTPN